MWAAFLMGLLVRGGGRGGSRRRRRRERRIEEEEEEEEEGEGCPVMFVAVFTVLLCTCKLYLHVYVLTSELQLRPHFAMFGLIVEMKLFSEKGYAFIRCKPLCVCVLT